MLHKFILLALIFGSFLTNFSLSVNAVEKNIINKEQTAKPKNPTITLVPTATPTLIPIHTNTVNNINKTPEITPAVSLEKLYINSFLITVTIGGILMATSLRQQYKNRK